MDTSQPVERLGIKPYNWWNEALHGVARADWLRFSATDRYGSLFLASNSI